MSLHRTALFVSLVVAAACGGRAPDPAVASAPPVAQAGADQAVASGAAVTLDGSASSDPAGMSLGYQWTQLSGPPVALSSATAPRPTFVAPAVAAGQAPLALVFSLTVRDAAGASTAAQVTVTVSPATAANPPPVANAGPDQGVASGAAVTLDGSGSGDPDGQPIAYAWSAAAGTSAALSGAGTAHPTFTAPTVAAGSAPVVLRFTLVVSDADASSAPATVSVTVSPAGSACLAGGPPPAPPGTPPPAPPGSPLPAGGSGSHRFEMGTYLPTGLTVVDPAAGEPRVEGLVVVTFGSSIGPAPADAVVTLNGVALRRVTGAGASGLFWELDPAGAQPVVGSGGQLVLVATATDPSTGKTIQRTLVLPCPADVEVAVTPAPGAALVPSTAAAPSAVHLASAADLTVNAGVPLMAGSPPTATLFGYDPCTRAISGYGSPHPIAPGPLALDVPVCGGAGGTCAATAAPAYLLDLRWAGTFVLDGQTGGFCALAKRLFFTR